MAAARRRVRARCAEGPGAVLSAAIGALLALALLPEPALAWGPGTHVAIGEAVLASLHLLPPAIATLLERFPVHFLYGSVAADISFAKKYAPVGRHCHNWHVGEEMLEEADSDPLKSVGLGYVAHLAADTLAHNVFVPRQLLLTTTTRGLGHTYWEHRMDVHVGERYLARSRALVLEHDHTEADEHFDRVLDATLFSFSTNRRIFRGMVRLGANERWIQVFNQVLKNSRFDVPDPLVRAYFERSFDFAIDYLVNRHRSRPASLDPVGEINLRIAKHVRHRELADGAVDEPELLIEAADRFFPMPRDPVLYAPPEHAIPAGEATAPGTADGSGGSDP